MKDKYQCRICKKELDASEAYEYRGAISCEEHFEEAEEQRNFERAEVIEENEHKTAPVKGLSLGNNPIGKINREILKPQIEIAKKESMRTELYEKGDISSSN